ncbi:MAG: MarR family winged helix-turn-helix transcriptional regulator [Cytophagaceae bacterium]
MNYEDQPLGLLLGDTLRLLSKSIRVKFIKLGMPVSPDQFGLLNLIDQKEESQQTELADIMAKDKSAVLRQLDSLERNGLISRSIDGNDRRKKNLVVTPEGAQIIKQGRGIIDALMDELTKNVPSDDLYTFKKILNQMKKNAE